MNNSSAILLIEQWIKCLLNQKIDKKLIHSTFYIEDGMTYNEYITYEMLQFSSLSPIYDLDEKFSIQLLASLPINNDNSDNNNEHDQLNHLYLPKTICFFYLINSLGKIVCKMNITIIEDHHQFYISSNNYYSQIVPKFSLNVQLNEQANASHISHISMAIKSPFQLNNMISAHFSLSSLSQGDNFKQDQFYHAKFNFTHQNLFNQFHQFHLVLQKDNDGIIIEKRKIYFDSIDFLQQLYSIKNGILSLNDQTYPVHLSYWKNGDNINHEYPRNTSITLTSIDKITITDCLDNDWNINNISENVSI